MTTERDDTSRLADARPRLLAHALRLEYFTVAWNVVEGGVAVVAAALAGSVALFGFGVDSFVESASGLVMIWRLRAERTGRLGQAELDRVEHRARRLVAASLFALAVFVAGDAIQSLASGDHPSFTAVGVGLAALSMLIMWWLARAKRRVARDLGSRAMETDAFQTTACWWLSLATLLGIGVNGVFGWWWADPVAALVIAGLIAKEGWASFRGESECC